MPYPDQSSGPASWCGLSPGVLPFVHYPQLGHGEDTPPLPCSPLRGCLPESPAKAGPEFKKYIHCTFTHPGLPGGGPACCWPTFVLLTQDGRPRCGDMALIIDVIRNGAFA